jgi:hypothetical protein
MFKDRPQIILGEGASERLIITPLYRLPNTMHGQGDNVIYADVQVTVGAFGARYRAPFQLGALEEFRAQVQRLYEELTGEAALTAADGWLRVYVTGTGRGSFVVRGEAQDHPERGNKLTFRLYFDQSFIPGIVENVDAILEGFRLEQKASNA